MAKKTESEKAKEALGFLDETEKQEPISDTQKKQFLMAVNILAIMIIIGAILLLAAVIYIFISNFEIVSPV